MLTVICSVSVQPSILIVPDVQDVYTPLTSDIVVQLAEVGSFSNLCGLHVAKKAVRTPLSASYYLYKFSAVNIWRYCWIAYLECFRITELLIQHLGLQRRYETVIYRNSVFVCGK